MGRDSPVERSSLGNASPWDARRGAQGSPGAAAPGAFWELFCGEKFPAGGNTACGLSARGNQIRLRRMRANEGIGPYGAPAANAPTCDSAVGAAISRPPGCDAWAPSPNGPAQSLPCVRGGGAQRRRG